MAEFTLLSRFIRWYPLTVPGTMTLAATLALAGLGFAASNPFNFFLGIFLFVVLCVLVVLNKLFSKRTRTHLLSWLAPAVHLSGLKISRHEIDAGDFTCAIFYRAHFRMSGRLDCSGKHAFFFAVERTVADKARTQIDLRLPLTGRLTVKGLFLFKDVFNLTRSVLGQDEYRQFPVLPVIPDSSITQSPVLSSADTQQKTSRKDNIEKYIMREYMAGDRLRDINWKASSRLSDWFTRISVEEDDVTRSIHVLFHHCVPSHYRGIKAYLAHDYLKGLLSSLILADTKTVFHIHTGEFDAEVSGPEEAAAFLRRFAELPPRDTAFNMPALEGKKTVLVFSSAFDHNLEKTLSTLAAHRLFVYRCSVQKKAAEYSLYAMDDMPGQFVPGLWALRSTRTARSVNPGSAVIWDKKLKAAWLSPADGRKDAHK